MKNSLVQRPEKICSISHCYTLDGDSVKLSAYRGQWIVLETGSLTCPMYVKNIRPIDKLAEKYPDVTFLVVYVREAHPGSRRGAHKNLDDKTSLAKETKAEYNDPRQVLVDDVDGAMHQAYGAFPNMVYIIDPDGKVVYRCDWSFAKHIDRILKDRPNVDKAERVQIITAAPWIMIPVTLKGGWDALWDLVIALPGILVLENDRRILAQARETDVGRRLMEIPGVGPLLASAFVATISDPSIFKSGRNLAAWIGLVPRQNSSGSTMRLGGISKAGNRYLRQMLIVGAMAVIRQAKRVSWPLRSFRRAADRAAKRIHQAAPVCGAGEVRWASVSGRPSASSIVEPPR